MRTNPDDPQYFRDSVPHKSSEPACKHGSRPSKCGHCLDARAEEARAKRRAALEAELAAEAAKRKGDAA